MGFGDQLRNIGLNGRNVSDMAKLVPELSLAALLQAMALRP